MNPQAREDVIRRCFAARAAKREKGLAALYKRKRRLYRAMCPSFGTKRRAGFSFLTIKKPGCNPVLLHLIAVPYAAAHGA